MRPRSGGSCGRRSRRSSGCWSHTERRSWQRDTGLEATADEGVPSRVARCPGGVSELRKVLGDLTHDGAELAPAPVVRSVLGPDPPIAARRDPEVAIGQTGTAISVCACGASELLCKLGTQRQIPRTPRLGAHQLFAGGAATLDVKAPGTHITARQPERLGRKSQPCHKANSKAGEA